MSEIGSGSGSSYPGALDTDSTLEVNSPNAGKTKARAEVPNDLAACIIALETELGTDPAGSLSDVKTFLQTEHGSNGAHTTNIISEKTAGTGVTVDGVLLKDSQVTTDVILEKTGAAGVTIDGVLLKDSRLAKANAPVGTVVQTVISQIVAYAGSLTGSIPIDDTIPQNTEGTEWTTQAFTPTSATNILLIEAAVDVYSGTAGTTVLALFQDTTADALSATVTSQAATSHDRIVLRYTMVAGTTSATTFKFRVGTTGGGTIEINGNGGARTLGGVRTSHIIIREIAQ